MHISGKSISLLAVVLLCFAGTASAQFGNGPQAPGDSGVFRIFIDDGSWGCFGFFDRDSLLFSAQCDNDGLLFMCGTATASSPVHVQRVTRQDADFVAQITLAPGAFTNVYDVTGFPAIDCDLLTNVTGRLLATGTANVIGTDNDLFGAGRGANAFSAHSNGTLLNAVHGGTTQFRLTARAVILPDDRVRGEITIQLTPDPR